MSALSFAAAVALILATPGPTNTLLAAAGARAGLRASLTLVPAEMLGYALAIAVWGLGLEPASAAMPWLPLVLRMCCVVYLLAVALALWRRAGTPIHGVPPQSAGRVFVATLLNPKALLFAVAVFPAEAFAGPAAFGAWIGLFAAVLTPIALGWIWLGSALAGGGGARTRLVERVAAVLLGSFSATLAATAFG
jgi:threonine/homoserine/homoserine lactone efflux protein